MKDCLFRPYGQGLRVKTGGRGEEKIRYCSDISFQHIVMDHVMTPFVVNSFYFCDPDREDRVCAVQGGFAGR